MKKNLKSRKHTFKKIDKFFQSLMDKPVFDKVLVLPDKLICLSKTCVSYARGSPRGMLMSSPRSRDKIADVPPPGLTTWANAPRLPGGDGHRWNWLMHYAMRFDATDLLNAPFPRFWLACLWTKFCGVFLFGILLLQLTICDCLLDQQTVTAVVTWFG